MYEIEIGILTIITIITLYILNLKYDQSNKDRTINVQREEIYQNSRALSDLRSKVSEYEKTNIQLIETITKTRQEKDHEIECVKMEVQKRDEMINAEKMFERIMDILEIGKKKSEQIKCKICMVREVNQVLNCGHSGCNTCLEGSAICPFCRGNVLNRNKLFIYFVVSSIVF